MAAEPEHGSGLRRILPYATVAVLVAVLYLGWVFYSRWASDRDLRQKAAQQQNEDLKKTYEMYGSGQVKIVSFYVSQDPIRAGEQVDLCYGVANAKTVKIDPTVGDVWPSLHRCMSVAPKQNTTYKLTADDGTGKTQEQSVVLHVMR